MKTFLLSISIVLIQLFASFETIAGEHKTIDLTTAGTLATELTSGELTTVTYLTVTGNIDARDIKTMRDEMPLLDSVDLTGVNIVAYTGTEGPGVGNIVYAANSFPQEAFRNKTTLQSIILPNSITYISKFCLDYTKIKHLTIPDNVTELSNVAIAEIDSLTSIHIGSSFETISSTSFYKLYNLENLTISSSNTHFAVENNVLFTIDKATLVYFPPGLTGTYAIPGTVTEIFVSAFAFAKVEEVIVPNSVTKMNTSNFDRSALKYINIPASLTDISALAFRACDSLIAFDVDENNPMYCDVDGVLYNKDKTKLIRYPFAKEEDAHELIESAKEIEQYCFYYYYERDIEIPIVINDSLETIGVRSFSSGDFDKIVLPFTIKILLTKAFYSSYFDTLICHNPTPPELESQVFTSTSYNSNLLMVPKGSLNAYQTHADWGLFQNIEEMSGYAISFNVSEGNTSIENVEVQIENVSTLNTDANGYAEILDLAPATYHFTISHEGFEEYSDSVIITSFDMEQDIVLQYQQLTGNASITGTLQFGEELSVAVTETNNTGTLNYQWKRDDSEISGANTSTYTLVEADITKSISVEVTSSDQIGSISSTGTAAIEKADQEVPVAPTLASKTHNNITLNVVEGCEYAIDGGAWQLSVEFTGLTAETTYSLTQRYAETASHKASAASDALNLTTDKKLTGTVTVTGTLQFDEELTVAVTETNNTGTLSYQWKRNDEAINGATSNTYTLVEQDITKSISVEVTSSVETGSISSTGTAAIEKADQDAPVAPTLESKTHNNITLNVVEGYEYAIDAGEWQSSAEFTGLSAETTYSLTQRYAETATHKASAASSTLNVTTELATSVGHVTKSNIKVYPNPAVNFIIVSGINNGDDLILFDIIGNKLVHKKVDSDKTILDLGNLNSGVYFIKSQNSIVKILIEK